MICVLHGQNQKDFSVDFSSVIGLIKSLSNVNAGPGQALAGYKDARIKMIRTHDSRPCDFPYYTNFFTTQPVQINPSFNPTDSSQYHWAATDSVITINHDNGFETFFRLGISFNLAGTHPYDYPPYDPNDTTYNNISEVFKRTVMHYNNGWDNGFHYGIKYWEVWNEPDGGFWDFSTYPAYTYYEMYEAVSNSIKTYDPNLKIGGAGFLSGSVVTEDSRGWITNFIDYCKNNNVPLDFLSWHLYGQHNPYAVYVYSNYIRNLLDTAGFTNVESFITETNIDLGKSNNPDLDSPKGAAWLASMLISAQMAPLDRLIMFRGNLFMNLLNNDVNGNPSYTWNGLGFKSFSVLADEAPIQIDAEGSVFISDSSTMATDTTNIMILASKTVNNDSCYILISNYNSSYTDYTINITHLPWASADSIRVTQYLTKPGVRYVESVSAYQAGNSVAINLHNVSAPSVVLLKISPITITGIESKGNLINTFNLEQNYPNPFNPSTIISFQIPTLSKVSLKVFDVLGREVRTLVNEEKPAGKYKIKFDDSKLGSGVYFYRIVAGSFIRTKKMLLLK
ncbi:MAG TPA: T9SS type A sorting domain-containing protein [Ignavibacteria bacterium]|nr:T9SS type A sorting domain-containing protein [Ignavibacteria bacterium]